MWDPDLAPELFARDRITLQRPLIAEDRWKSAAGENSSEGTFCFSGSRTASLRADLDFCDLSPFDRLSIPVANHSAKTVLVGLRLLHGANDESTDVSLSGGREPLLPGQTRELLFPVECFGTYGCPEGWRHVRGIEMTLAIERGEQAPHEIRVSAGTLSGESRVLPEGPRLTEAGLHTVTDARTSGRDSLWGQWAGAEPCASGSRKARYTGTFGAGDPGLFIPAPHGYARNSADEILQGSVMGQKLGQPLQWDLNPLGALEWAHFLHRHHFLRELVAACAETGDQRYAEALANIISRWIGLHPVPLGSNGGAGPAWETLSVAWRLREWIWVAGIAWLSPAFPIETKNLMFRSIWEHARCLMDHQGHPNNWLIVESSALALVGLCFPQFRESASWQRTGVERLQNEIGHQFFADGVHFEISPLYHAICVHAVLDVRQAADMRGEALPEIVRELPEKGAAYLAALCRPNFTWPSINDAGGSDADYTALMNTIGRVFSRPDLAWIGSRGRTGSPPATGLQIFPEAGIAVMRSSYASDANHLVFRAGPPGASHIHRDILSLDVTALGVPRLSDPGITSYAPGVMSEYYRSSQAHNTILLNGKGTDLSRMTHAEGIAPSRTGLHWASGKDLDVVTGVCRGPWHGTEAAWTVHRTVVFVKPDYWLVRDTVLGEGDIEVTTCWQFAPGLVDVDIDTYRAACLDARGPRFEIVPAYGFPQVVLEIHTGSLRPPRGWVSLHGTDFPAPHLEYSVRQALPVSQVWILLPFSGRPASGVKIRTRAVDDAMLSLEIGFPEGRVDVITMPRLFDPPLDAKHGIRLTRQ